MAIQLVNDQSRVAAVQGRASIDAIPWGVQFLVISFSPAMDMDMPAMDMDMDFWINKPKPKPRPNLNLPTLAYYYK